LYDEPDERKLHATGIPRLGGFSFVPIILFSLAFAVAIIYQYNSTIVLKAVRAVFSEMLLLVCGLLFLYLIGLWDDLIGARYRIKFLVQILAASFIPISGLWIDDFYGLFGIFQLKPWLGIPFTIFLTVFIVNAINLIDGIDGLASGLSCIALTVMGVFFMINGSLFFSMLAFSTIGVLLSFFYYNVFGKNKIFMGDTGSLTLGYILAFLAIRLTVVDTTILPAIDGSIMIAFSTLIIPIFDVFRVVLIRIRNKKHLFVADTNHIHHQFLKLGFTPRRAMVWILFIATLFCTVNIFMLYLLNITVLFLIDIFLWIGMHVLIRHILNRKSAEIKLSASVTHPK
jgi:UDP-N-acetylmuramyl pentapeptide phosphotransferase/UDP-N-acetylglucosamine-1-phosphate transferase